LPIFIILISNLHLLFFFLCNRSLRILLEFKLFSWILENNLLLLSRFCFVFVFLNCFFSLLSIYALNILNLLTFNSFLFLFFIHFLNLHHSLEWYFLIFFIWWLLIIIISIEKELIYIQFLLIRIIQTLFIFLTKISTLLILAVQRDLSLWISHCFFIISIREWLSRISMLIFCISTWFTFLIFFFIYFHFIWILANIFNVSTIVILGV
jgi:hypothetical protein